MPKITLLTTGGTIAMTAGADGGQLRQTPPFAAMLEQALPGLTVAVVPVLAKPSASFTFADIARVADAARAAAKDSDGVIVTHGTDVLEETAFALSLLTREDAPIVVTGAMRLANQPSADGDANLIAAARTALCPGARGLVLTVFDDEIHWAPLAKKRHAFRTHAFSSEPFGPLGWVREDTVRFMTLPAQPLPHLAWGGGTPVIPILESGPALEPAVLEKLDGVDALVLSLPGGGHVAAPCVPVLEKLAAKMPVVFATRTGAGETLTKSYGYDGGEIDLMKRGLIGAGWLDGRRARILLAILLSNGATPAAIADTFGRL